ncbi:alpha/beta fold hydrolase [Bordetella petrii]|nr:alpha/beta fold hydrolase [Bordetella petrii]
MPTVTTQDISVDTAEGRLFARRWTPDTLDTRQAPMVLFHDSLGCVELWRDFPRQLAAATGRAVIAYDRLGFGRSDPYPGELQAGFIEQEARQGFRRVHAALGLDQFVALGHSVGGGMALVCAVVHEASCRALITESAQMYTEEFTLQGIRQAREAFAQPGQLDRLKKYHGDKAAWVLSAWIDTWLSPRFADWHLDDYLRAVRCPVLSLHGGEDEYGSLEHPRRLATLAGARSVIFEACGHVPHREQPERVIAEITQWLRQPASAT